MGGNIEIVKMFLSLGSYNLNEGLQYSCASGNTALVNMLLELGANDYNKGLKYACYNGHYEIAKLMLSLGTTDVENALLVVCQCEDEYVEIVKLLIENGASNFFAFQFACEKGHKNIIDILINYGLTNYNEGLIDACKGKQSEIAKMLLKLGANNYYVLKDGNLELKILYERLTREVITLPIKHEHPEYHLLKVYNKKVPDIDRLINKYLF